jgi:large subunit ribosomal protein L4
LENFSFAAPKTKEFVQVMDNLKLTGTKVLLVLTEGNHNVVLSARNIPKMQIVRPQDLNTYDILHADQLVIVKDAVSLINEQLG